MAGADRLTVLRAQARSWATDFPQRGLTLDTNDAHPDGAADLLDLPGVRYLSTIGIPPRFGGTELKIGPHRFDGQSVLERAVLMEEFAVGDAGVLMACPGPSMSGVLVEHLADDQQKEHFYGKLLDKPTWTFFALTEAERGSDAGAMSTTIGSDADGTLRLRGSKRYIGNAARASLGVVFARTGPAPLAIGSVLLDLPAQGFSVRPLATIGLRGAQLCDLQLDGVQISEQAVLGRQLRASKRGLRASIEVFNKLRPGVAAIGLGIARAAQEYVEAQWSAPPPSTRDRMELLRDRIGAARGLVLAAARRADDGGDGVLASAAKATAARLAEEATLIACDVLGPGARLTHPTLEKLLRDARGVEYMEGTRNMQLLNVFRGLRTGSLVTVEQREVSHAH